MSTSMQAAPIMPFAQGPSVEQSSIFNNLPIGLNLPQPSLVQGAVPIIAAPAPLQAPAFDLHAPTFDLQQPILAPLEQAPAPTLQAEQLQQTAPLFGGLNMEVQNNFQPILGSEVQTVPLIPKVMSTQSFVFQPTMNNQNFIFYPIHGLEEIDEEEEVEELEEIDLKTQVEVKPVVKEKTRSPKKTRDAKIQKKKKLTGLRAFCSWCEN